MELVKYTPIKCYKTNIALNLGDNVKDLQERCGVLAWDDFYNSYYIKTPDGGKINTIKYVKIDKIFQSKHDNTNVECRRRPARKKW
jgi:hypothetical protein